MTVSGPECGCPDDRPEESADRIVYVKQRCQTRDQVSG